MPVSPWIGSSSTAAVPLVDRGRERLGVVARHGDEAGHERRERLLLVGLGRGRQRAHRAPVEGALEHDDLAAAPALAGQLDRGLVGLGAGVAQEHARARG